MNFLAVSLGTFPWSINGSNVQTTRKTQRMMNQRSFQYATDLAKISVSQCVEISSNCDEYQAIVVNMQ